MKDTPIVACWIRDGRPFRLEEVSPSLGHHTPALAIPLPVVENLKAWLKSDAELLRKRGNIAGAECAEELLSLLERAP